MGDWDDLKVGDCFVASLLAMTMLGEARGERTTERADGDVCRANMCGRGRAGRRERLPRKGRWIPAFAGMRH